MIPRASAVFPRGCKLISLRVVPCQVTAKASAPQAESAKFEAEQLTKSTD
jgi:hypothetical protein